MPERPWSEFLTDTSGAPSLLLRILRAISTLVVIGVGFGIIWTLLVLNHNQINSRDDVIRAGSVRLERSLAEETRTETLICLAHPEQRHAQPLFDHMCTDVIRRWQVNTSAAP